MHHQLLSQPRRRDHFTVSRVRREALRTNLWLVPSAMVGLAAVLFAVTYLIDRAVPAGILPAPGAASSGTPGDARALLIGLAAAVITVAGVVFSITILVLQLASQQFGPRMLRNFIRDRGTQLSLGAFVGTFVYCVLTLGAVASAPSPDFVPHLSVTCALLLSLVDLGVVIYFVHNIAVSIQLTSVVSGIAADFRRTLAAIQHDAAESRGVAHTGPGADELRRNVMESAAEVSAQESGFLQAIGHRHLMRIAVTSDAVILLLRRPGHFVVQGERIAAVLPSHIAGDVADALARAHIVGPNRTLTQDMGFAIDQLVEVAIRALSPAVNDTFTALNCIDWLGDCLCRAAAEALPDGVHRDVAGTVRIIEPAITFDRLLKGATDKIRQAASGMPAVYIRQLENLAKLRRATEDPRVRDLIEHHAAMIVRAAEGSVQDTDDRADVRRAWQQGE